MKEPDWSSVVFRAVFAFMAAWTIALLAYLLGVIWL